MRVNYLCVSVSVKEKKTSRAKFTHFRAPIPPQKKIEICSFHQRLLSSSSSWWCSMSQVYPSTSSHDTFPHQPSPDAWQADFFARILRSRVFFFIHDEDASQAFPQNCANKFDIADTANLPRRRTTKFGTQNGERTRFRCCRFSLRTDSFHDGSLWLIQSNDDDDGSCDDDCTEYWENYDGICRSLGGQSSEESSKMVTWHAPTSLASGGWKWGTSRKYA